MLFGKISKWLTDLKTVCFTGSYNDLSNKPNLHAVATSGNYNQLNNRPTIGAAASRSVVNNATTTSDGTVLDGRMGKTLMDRLLQDSSQLQTVLNNLIRSNKTIGSAYAVTATYRSNAYLTTVYWSGTHVGDKMAAYTQRNFGTLPAGHRPNAKCQVPVAGVPGLYLTVEPSGIVSMRNEHYAEISFSKVSVYGALTFIN